MSLLEATAIHLLAEMEAGRLTSAELTQACLDQIAAHDKSVGAFLRVDGDKALAKAREVDERRSKKQPVGRLAGLPVAVKDLLCSRGERTTCASKILENFVAPYDSTVVARLKEADAV